jgi:hypothetical protein
LGLGRHFSRLLVLFDMSGFATGALEGHHRAPAQQRKEDERSFHSLQEYKIYKICQLKTRVLSVGGLQVIWL